MNRALVGEVARVVVPFAVLGGVVWWRASRRPPTATDYLPRVVSIKQATPSPLDAYRGLDTRVEITTVGANAKPRDASDDQPLPPDIALRNAQIALEGSQGAVSRPVPVKISKRATDNGQTFACSFNLRRFAPGFKGGAMFRASVVQSFRPDARKRARRSTAWIDTSPVGTGLRVNAGRVSRAGSASVSRARPFRVKRVEVRPEFRVGGTATPGRVRVWVVLQHDTNDVSHEAMEMFDIRVLGADGRDYTRPKSRGGADLGSFYRCTSVTPEGTNTLSYVVLTRRVPASAGALTFRAMVSVDECWPVPVSATVRRKDGALPVVSGPLAPDLN